jgi:hypothetical protein
MAFNIPALIDPLATILPTEIYLILQEKLHPNVPLTDALKHIAAQASPEQHAFILARAKMVHGLSGAVISTVTAAGQR